MTLRRRNNERPLIIHVVYRFDVGGLENGIVNLINAMPAEDWRHGIVALDEVSPSFFSRIRDDNVFHVSLHKPPGHALRVYPELFKLFRRHRPLIVHTRNLAALEATIPAWLARVPVRIHGEHGREMDDLDGCSAKHRWIRRIYSPWVNKYIALSQDLESYLRVGVRIASDRITQIYNGVDTDRFTPATRGRAAIRECPFSDSRYWLVGTVGRMQAVKNQVNLARAFVRAIQTSPEARTRMRLIMVGDGPLRAQTEEILSRAGASELAWFSGERTDVPDILRGLNCFVLPSLGEGISNTILEAMASELPVIATRVGGNSELVEDGLTGTLVPSADSQAMARALLGYLTDPATARRHGKAGRQRVAQRFSISRMALEYQAVYRSTLPRRGGAVNHAATV